MRATVHALAARRPVLGFDRAAILERNRRAFAAGHQARCAATAAELEALAAEIRRGAHGELVLAQAGSLIALRHRGRS